MVDCFGEVLVGDDFVGGGDGEPLDDIGELFDISVPVMFLKGPEGFVFKGEGVGGVGRFFEHCFGDTGDVFSATFEGWNVKMEYIEMIEKVGSEEALLDLIIDVFGTGDNEPYIDGERFVAG